MPGNGSTARWPHCDDRAAHVGVRSGEFAGRISQLVIAAVSLVLCVIYGRIVPTGLRMASFLEMALPAFRWLTFWGF